MNQPPNLDAARRKSVAVCDDHPALVGVLSHILNKRGFRVFTAGDGSEGLEVLRHSQPDLLLLDLNMPFLDGLGVLQGLATLPKKPYTIMISGQESTAKRDRALELGAREIWRKPFTPSELVGRIDALLEQGLV